MRCPPSISWCRRRPMWRSAATRSAGASPASPPRNRTRPTPRSSCSATRSTRPARPSGPTPGSPIGPTSAARSCCCRASPIRSPRSTCCAPSVADARSTRELVTYPRLGHTLKPVLEDALDRTAAFLRSGTLGRLTERPRLGPPQYEFALVSVDRARILTVPQRPRHVSRVQPHPTSPRRRPRPQAPQACSPASPPRPGRRSARSPRRPGRKEPHCECCQAASRRSSSRPSRRSSSSESSARRPPWPTTRPVWRASCTPWARSNRAGTTTARNASSGAYGKYQIMPVELAVLGAAATSATRARSRRPANQEIVAAGKFRSLYRGLDSWRRVAYWWLTGSSRTTGWSAYATRYVEQGHDYLPPTPRPPAATRRPARRRSAASIATPRRARGSPTRGTWRTAGHRGYAGDAAQYATKAGATASFTFTGTKVIWYGPVGPTRGKARILIDGTLREDRRPLRAARSRRARPSSARAGRRPARTPSSSRCVGTAGHPYVAIDGFTVVD